MAAPSPMATMVLVLMVNKSRILFPPWMAADVIARLGRCY
jgi:hypothetical protein